MCVNIVLIGIEEGDHLVSDMGSNIVLGRLPEEYNLTKYIIKNPSQQDDIPQTTLATTIEAIVGAVWFDSNKDIKKVEYVVDALHVIK